jgi:hypothetical protein
LTTPAGSIHEARVRFAPAAPSCVSVALSGIGIRCAFRPRSFGSSSLPAHTKSSPWRNADAPSSKVGAFGRVGSSPAGDTNMRGWRNPDALGLNPGGPRSCRFKSCAAHQSKNLLPSPSGSRHHVYTVAFSVVRIRPGARVRSSVAERDLDTVDVGGSIPSGCTIHAR